VGSRVAQLAAADLSLAFAGQGPGRFEDLGSLTIFADKPILDRILSPWIVELTRRIKPQQKADVEDRLRRAGYPFQTD
jgi:hypothetical protein